MLFDWAPDGILITDGGGTYLDGNPSICRMLGYSRDELIGRHATDSVAPSEREHVQSALNAIRASSRYHRLWQLRRKDGSVFAAELSGSTLPNGNLMAIIRDVSERQAAAARIERLTQLYAAFSQCNQAIVRCTDEAELFPKICRDAVHFGGMKLAWIGLLDEAGKRLAPVAACGDGAERVQETGMALAVDACFWAQVTDGSPARQQPFWCQDFLTAAVSEPWRELGERLGWRAWAMLPLFRNGAFIGALSLYAGTVDAFDEDARELLIEVATDISFALDNFAREDARRQAEDERRKYETIVRHAGWGMAIADPETHAMAFVNPAFEQMHGYAPGEMDGMNLADTFAPESRADLPVHARIVEQNGHHEYESIHLRKDGSTFPCQTDVTAFKDADGRVRFRAATFEDITQRKQAEEALRASERRLRQLLDGLGPALFVGLITPDGVIVEANRPALEVASLTLADVLGRRLEETHWFAYSEAVQDRLREAIGRAARGEPRRYDERIRAAGDQLIDIDFSVQPLRDDSGKVVFLVPSASVITERKRAEQEVRTLNAELEQRVVARTAQLAAVNKELDTFSYMVSHDLKAPLRGIDGYSRLLEDDLGDRLGAEGKTFLRNIREGASLMHALIEDLLAYSRMERRHLERTALDLAACVAAVTAEQAAELTRRGVVLQVTVPPLVVRADREGLLVVLRNLLDNALKFSQAARPPMIEIGARRDAGKVILWVRDNGIGFDMRFQERVFEIFSRLQRAEDYPGSGVGLALVRKAMQRMGGRIWVESAPAQGATFFLEMPA